MFGVWIEMSEWIDLKKEPPKDCEKVLIFTNRKEMAMGYFIIEDQEITGMKYDGTVTSLSTWALRGVIPKLYMRIKPPK